jgi:hypothetical protein
LSAYVCNLTCPQDREAWLRVPQTLLPHKGPPHPLPTPCHYISHGPPPRSCSHRAIVWWWGSFPKCSGTGRCGVVRGPCGCQASPFDASQPTHREYSYAPLSQPFPCSRLTPRWSLNTPNIIHTSGGIRSIAALLASNLYVLVGPPLSRSTGSIPNAVKGTPKTSVVCTLGDPRNVAPERFAIRL